MSIWVRLIGGDHNGQVAKVDDDQVEAVLKSRSGVRPFRGGIAAASYEVRTTRYTRRTVNNRDGEIVFFALDTLTDFEALQSVLGP